MFCGRDHRNYRPHVGRCRPFSIRLPFSFAEVIANLRLEHYAVLDAEHLVYGLAEVSSQENSLR